jgi:DNA-binding GntR family transcriptional regulator
MTTNPAYTSRTDQTISLLRKEILSGQIEPGNLLAESAVAVRLGVSRMPVREALFTLEREGFVEFSGTGRAFVKALSPQDFEELYKLRLLMEPLAARLASSSLKADASLLEKNIKDTGRAKNMLDVTRLDLEFHEIILEASGNGRLLKLWRSLRGELELWLGRLHRRHQVQKLDTRAETIRSHRTIVDCFKQQSPDACEALMRKHITGWREWLPALPALPESEWSDQ